MRKTKDVYAEDENGIHIGPVLHLIYLDHSLPISKSAKKFEV